MESINDVFATDNSAIEQAFTELLKNENSNQEFYALYFDNPTGNCTFTYMRLNEFPIENIPWPTKQLRRLDREVAVGQNIFDAYVTGDHGLYCEIGIGIYHYFPNPSRYVLVSGYRASGTFQRVHGKNQSNLHVQSNGLVAHVPTPTPATLTWLVAP